MTLKELPDTLLLDTVWRLHRATGHARALLVHELPARWSSVARAQRDHHTTGLWLERLACGSCGLVALRAALIARVETGPIPGRPRDLIDTLLLFLRDLQDVELP